MSLRGGGEDGWDGHREIDRRGENGKHSWACDSGDHSETPFLAYSDLSPILRILSPPSSSSSSSSVSPLRIYDPYYCAGSVVSHLQSLGFPHVYNRPIDFYSSFATTPPTTPPFDFLVTNPPFSSDHPRRAFRFAILSGRPFALLLPNYETRSEWITEEMEIHNVKGLRDERDLILLAPHKRYVCRSPADLRPIPSTASSSGSKGIKKDKNKARKYVAPFPLVWIIGVPDKRDRVRILSEWQSSSSFFSTSSSPSSTPPPYFTSSHISTLSLVQHWSDLPPSSSPRVSKTDPLSVLKKKFNDFCKERGVGKLCAQFAITGNCDCVDRKATPPAASAPLTSPSPSPVVRVSPFTHVCLESVVIDEFWKTIHEEEREWPEEWGKGGQGTGTGIRQDGKRMKS